MRSLLLLLLIVVAYNSNAQFDLVNRTVVRRDSAFIFRNEYNELVIVPYKQGKWQLTARYADVNKTDSPWIFVVETMHKGTDTLRLVRNGVTVVRKAFRVIEAPGFVFRWGAIRKDSASVSEILANKKLVALAPGCNCSGRLHIFGFDLELVSNAVPEWKKIQRLHSNTLTTDIIQLIRQLSPGDKVVFKDLYVEGRAGRIRVVPGFTITIK